MRDPPPRRQVPVVHGPVLVLQAVEDVGSHDAPVTVHGVQQADGASQEVNLHAHPMARFNVDGDEQLSQLEDIPGGGVVAPESDSIVVVVVC